MPGEKELNVTLLRELKTIEDALKLARKENATETIAFLENEKVWLERMLYQTPPVSQE
ncbi:MAG: hypothetical protein IJT16_10165 [Lachnospiraceae bacterium]|nr:hypothetical protein [Lachnospiraceae bacterium]